MRYGLESSKRGKNLDSSTKDNDLTITSDYLTFSIYKQGNTTVTIGDNGGNEYGKYYRKTVSHDLGYPGQLMAFSKVPEDFGMTSEEGEWFPIPYNGGVITGYGLLADDPYLANDDIDSNSMRFSFVSLFDAPFSANVDISYLLFTDSLIREDFINTKKEGYGINVSKSGDVKNLTAENLSFSASYPVLQIEKQSGIIDIPASTYGSWGKMTFPHNLGYVPAFDGYFRLFSEAQNDWFDWSSHLYYAHSNALPAEEVGCKISVDKDNLYVYYRNGIEGSSEKSGDMEIKYNIFTNKIADE